MAWHGNSTLIEKNKQPGPLRRKTIFIRSVGRGRSREKQNLFYVFCLILPIKDFPTFARKSCVHPSALSAAVRTVRYGTVPLNPPFVGWSLTRPGYDCLNSRTLNLSGAEWRFAHAHAQNATPSLPSATTLSNTTLRPLLPTFTTTPQPISCQKVASDTHTHTPGPVHFRESRRKRSGHASS